MKVTDFNNSQPDCVFCKIVRGEIPTYKIYEDALTIAFLSIEPYFMGHALVVPKFHAKDIHTMEEKSLKQILITGQKIAKAMKEVLPNLEGVNFFQNNGEISGQTVMHYHMHILPRYKGSPSGGLMELGRHYEATYKPSKDDLKDLADLFSKTIAKNDDRVPNIC